MKLIELLENKNFNKIELMTTIVNELGSISKIIKPLTKFVNGKQTNDHFDDLISSATSSSALISTIPGTTKDQVEKLVNALNNNQKFKDHWIAKIKVYPPELEKYYPTGEFSIVTKEEYARRNKSKKVGIKMPNIDKNIKPITKFNNKDLAIIAKKVGHQLFDKHPSGLIWGSGKVEIIKINTFELIKEEVEILGDKATGDIGTFEFVFFPSNQTGIDPGMKATNIINLIKDEKKIKDIDGNIYLCDNSDTPQIRIVKPNVKSDQLRDLIDYLANN